MRSGAELPVSNAVQEVPPSRENSTGGDMLAVIVGIALEHQGIAEFAGWGSYHEESSFNERYAAEADCTPMFGLLGYSIFAPGSAGISLSQVMRISVMSRRK